MPRMLLLLSVLTSLVMVFGQSGVCKAEWCPKILPPWPASWKSKASTITEPCNFTGLISSESTRDYSVVNVDWSNGRGVWVTAQPMNASEMLVAQAQLLTTANPGQRVWTYKNIVKALPWMREVREKLEDPAYAGWFLTFKEGGVFPNKSWHVPACDTNYDPPLCSPFYHDQEQTPEYPGQCVAPHCNCGGIPVGEYLYNHKNESLRDWLINDYILGPTGVSNSTGISGVYLDDQWSNVSSTIDAPDCASSPIGGPTEENANCVVDMGLTQDDTTAIYNGWKETMIAAAYALVKAGGFSWAFTTEIGMVKKGAVCRSFFNENASQLYNVPLIVTVSTPTALDELAFFLTIRGPYAWIGFGWRGCEPPPPLPQNLTVEFGEPQGNFTFDGEIATREWTLATATFNCTTGHGNVVMK
jgi:hypothetical protein